MKEEQVRSFKKKPIIIEALRWTGDNFKDMEKFCTPATFSTEPGDFMTIETLEGDHKANVGDWIIKGIAGEFYPCKPDIFAETYEFLEMKAIDEVTETILPSDRDPIKMNEVMKDQKKGVEWIKARAEQILEKWHIAFFETISWNDAELIALEIADLENDFNYIKDLNTTMSIRYEEVWDCLPSLTEIDALIQVVDEVGESDASFFCTAEKDDRLKKLKKLRSAIAYAQGSK